jgi:hypothetical protein
VANGTGNPREFHVAQPARAGNARSTALIAFLLRVPRLILVLAVMAVLLAGAFAPAPFGPVLLAAIAALVAWLTWLNWSAASVSGRLIRLTVVAALLAFAVTKF